MSRLLSSLPNGSKIKTNVGIWKVATQYYPQSTVLLIAQFSAHQALYGKWHLSTARNYLNSTFYNSLSSELKNYIVPINLNTDGNATTDNVFILTMGQYDSSYDGVRPKDMSYHSRAYDGNTYPPHWSSSNQKWYIASNLSTGFVPSVALLPTTPVSDTVDADGCYTIYVNIAPTSPSSITVPSTVKGGETLAISWGTSTDTDGNLSGYKLERSVNGGAYTQIYAGANRSYTDAITKGWNTVAYRVKAYDSDSAESGYTTSATRTVINNTAPIISGQDTNLGDKNLGFVISYQVDDVDASDSLIVIEKLNGSTIRTVNGAPRKQNLEIEIKNTTLFSLPLNSENTIEIKVDDQQGGIAYRRFTFRRTNSAPIISGNDEDLGQKIDSFSVDFSVSDNEGNAITVKTYLNGIKKEEYTVVDGATNTFTISKEDWYKLGIGQYIIKIEATDEHGATAVRNYTFSRYDYKIQFTLKNPIETDIMGTKILVTPTWTIPQGATAKVEACNNAFDDIPSWEDITSQVLISRHYNFTNIVKTAAKWGINIRFTIEKGTATEQAVVNGFGGAFE